MGDAYTGIDGSLWHRNLEDKFEKMRTLVTEIVIEEPQLSDRIRKEVDEVLNKEDKRRKLTLKEAALTSLTMAIVMFGLVGLLYI